MSEHVDKRGASVIASHICTRSSGPEVSVPAPASGVPGCHATASIKIESVNLSPAAAGSSDDSTDESLHTLASLQARLAQLEPYDPSANITEVHTYSSVYTYPEMLHIKGTQMTHI